jgi:alanyl-tRNA synthetase
MGLAYPELVRAKDLIAETLELEEIRFKRTLERGLRLLAEETASLQQGGVLKGEVAFKLYDTYGFPLDLTQDALRGQGYSVDLDGFEREMTRQREDARKAWAGSGEAATEQVWFDIRTQHGATEFLGYDAEEAAGRVVAIVVDGKQVDEATAGANAAIVVNQTPFYAESGGQQGDHGALWTDAGGTLTVGDTQKKLGALHVHIGSVSKGALKIGDEVHMSVDGERRSALRGHHSATHLLHAALRRRLGEHVTQKGSLVAAERLRFDISHPKPISAEDMAVIESEVNKQIRANTPVVTRLMTPEEAIDAGAMALFGEKYGDEVRVLSMGEDGNRPYSVELCGGTHARRTGDIGLFKVIAESAVAAGVRRIEAVTGAAAEAYVTSEENTLQAAANLLRVGSHDLASRIENLLEERKRLEKELSDARRALATGGGGGSAPEVKEVNGVKFIGKVLDGVPAKDLKGLADDLKSKVGSGVVALIGVADGKGSIVVGVTDDHVKAHSAVDLVRVGSAALGGKGGGGRPDMAQAGGPDGDRAADALAAIESALSGAKAAE